METQWNVGFGGATGLKYECLPIVMRLLAVPRAQWQDVFASVRIRESVALRFFAWQREQQASESPT